MFVLAACVLVLCSAEARFTNEWVVRLEGGPRVARAVAAELGYDHIGEVRGFEDTYILKKRDHPTRSKREAPHLTKRLSDDVRVAWAEQQYVKERVKRGPMPSEGRGHLELLAEQRRFNDQLWPNQWYLHDTRDMSGLPQLDHHVTEVWDMNITGRGIVVTILDDGLEWNHTDIQPNYDPEASYDLNEDKKDPFPRYDETNSNNHGTRCAGEVAMVANNTKCGVGVAYNAKIGGIRMLDGRVTDSLEGAALAFNQHHIHIYSASWGPTDDGMTLDGPGRLAREALERGVTSGRGGKGVIFVWAAGNGGMKGDNCNCDGYTSSPYTLSVASASQHGHFPWYGERCASTLASTFSSGAYQDQMISTSDLYNTCTSRHTGTSASAPLAAGMFALVLEANPELTWRDLQHLAAWNTDIGPIIHNRGWRQNGAGLLYNSRFGFGLLNGLAMVQAARGWTHVPPRVVCDHLNATTRFPVSIKSGQEAQVNFHTNACQGTDHEINFLEHVQLTAEIGYSFRGALDIFLVSPSGSLSMLLSRRQRDQSISGFNNWPFLSVHFWGENPRGNWTLIVRDKEGKDYKGTIKNAYLTFYGTKEKPEHMKLPQYQEMSTIRHILEKSEEYDENDDVRGDDDREIWPQRHLGWQDLVKKNWISTTH